MSAHLPEELAALATAHGVATTYVDTRGRPLRVPPTTVRAVLAAMDVRSDDGEAVRSSLRLADEAPWRRILPPTLVTRGDAPVPLTVPERNAADARLVTADGAERALTLDDGISQGPERTLDGIRLHRRHVRLPEGLPRGTHRMIVRAGDDIAEARLLVVPARCPVPEGLRSWGWQVQLYALRSAASWGMGDLADLRGLLTGSAGPQGAGLVLLNPLHAVMPVPQQEPSPYYPASRRFVNPLYLRVEECDGYTGLTAEARARIDALAAGARNHDRDERVERGAVFGWKREAFELLAAQPLPPDRQEAFAGYQRAEGQGLVDFAVAAALAEQHGRSFRDWPAALQDPRSDAVASARRELADRVRLHLWLQWQCDTQLHAAQTAAREGGMPVGIVTDLAVGVDPGGADAWALQADLALGVTVGAPPDAFNQQGQDWRVPPLRPDRLPETGFAPFRDVVRSQLRQAGGLRIDHAMGLFRLFWIPEGAPSSEGTYVRYPADALLGILALEAEAAGAVIIGEDLGTVERGVPETLRGNGVLGSRVLWFEREERGRHGQNTDERIPRRRARDYPELALTSVTTHDLPTAAGFLAGEATRVRATLGQLAHPEAEQANAAEERASLLALLIREGLLDEDDAAHPAAVVEAMHAFVARTPSVLVAANLADAVGDLRQPNLPGTVKEYPNWSLPVAQPTGEPPAPGELLPPSRPLLVEELLAHPRVLRLAAVMRAGREAGKQHRASAGGDAEGDGGAG
ncbi:MAG: 4-alpha-glucanotransferase [Nitriliruptorales bacterium]|nr:4-alpha-glucanotransferase [Nitriliruptorales bacterium]